jgi:hypothetical protein
MPGSQLRRFTLVEEVRLMRTRTKLLSCFIALLTLTCAACGVYEPHAAPAVVHHTAGPTVIASPTVLSTSHSASRGIADPVRLLIPVIGVNAPVESLGILPDGSMAIPTRNPWTDAGWYNAGPRPGERGSAVMDGHLDRPGGSPAVFWRLRDLHAGDKVMVVDAHGKTLHFHVTRITFYSAGTVPFQEIFGDPGGIYLNLITCAGDWIPAQHQTTLRLVVYTSFDS